jgi:hypothetical protein
MPKKYEFPIAQSPPTFAKFLAKLKEYGRPNPGADHTWLQSIGYRSGNHKGYLGILRAVGAIGAKSVPTDLWSAFQSPNDKSAAELGQQMRTLYAPLAQNVCATGAAGVAVPGRRS